MKFDTNIVAPDNEITVEAIVKAGGFIDMQEDVNIAVDGIIVCFDKAGQKPLIRSRSIATCINLSIVQRLIRKGDTLTITF